MMTSHDSSSNVRSSSFDLLDKRLQKWAWQQEWEKLHEIQEKAIKAVMSSPESDVVVAAPTAGGKTEAVFLPILSILAAETEKLIGFRVLCVSPLRALIDDQHRRLAEIADLVDVPVTAWHGDVSQSTRTRAMRNPSGILLTTPESLEAFFVVRGDHLQRLFAPLQFVVVDELHTYLAAERGRQIQSLMHRLDVVIGHSARRVALSATLGDLNRAAAFLRPSSSGKAIHIRTRDEGELLMALLGFADEASGIPLGQPEAAMSGLKLAVADEIPRAAFHALRGKSNLLFANTRAGVEMYADKLRRLCEAASVPNEFFAHHGSLSKPLRKHAEDALRNPNRPATAVCTSTLELGIDIGQIESVGQIGCPPSVSSIRQRLGRSGRRGNPAILRLYVTEYVPRPDSNIEERLHLRLIQTIAQLDLLLDGWCETPTVESLHLSTLLHQILSMIAEKGGVTASESWRVLCNTGPFGNVEKDIFIALLHQMGKRNLVEQAPNGTLLLGSEGERLHRQRGFYAIFHTPEEYVLMAPDGPLGSLPISHPLIPGNHMIFGGQRWLIRDVDNVRRVVTLVPSPAGKPPRFAGSGWLVGREVRERMRSALSSKESRAYLDGTAEFFLRAAQGTFADLGLAQANVIEHGGDSYLFCWTSDLIRHTLRAMLGTVACHVDLQAVALRCPGMSPRAFEEKLREVLASDHDAVALAFQVGNRETEKYDEYLGDELTAIDYASRMIRIQDTRSYIEGVLGELSLT